MAQSADFTIISEYMFKFLMILMRTSIFFAMLPTFSSKNVPVQFKIGMAIAFSLVLTPIVEVKTAEDQIAFLIIKDALFAMIIGMTSRLSFFAVSMAGQMISNAMALSMATVFDPEFGQSAEMSRLLITIATLLFFAMDIHHDIIIMLVRSYEAVPFGKLNIPAVVDQGLELAGITFLFTAKISAPIVTGMLVNHILLGFIYKAAPQINVFFVSFPLLLITAFLILYVSTPVFLKVVGLYFENIKTDMYKIMLKAGS
ncbi:Type III secretion system inner membrane R protein [Candidatus Magnetoovum chiemensis]|nr:Type III secretion system inner membrane R protein [Candidatus Magnetoovum chiemensis]